MSGPTEAQVKLLVEAVTALNMGKPFMVEKAKMKVWLDLGHVEMNEAVKEGKKVAFRASLTGKEWINANLGPGANALNPNPAPAAPIYPPGQAPVFPGAFLGADTGGGEGDGDGEGDDDEGDGADENPKGPRAIAYAFEDNIAIPPLRRGGRGHGVNYGFDAMAVGQSFFIPATETNPKPSKRIGAVVSAASKDLAPKKFRVQTVVEKRPDGGTREGARIWRIS